MPSTRPFITDRLRAKVRGLLDRTLDYKCTVKRGGNPASTSGYNQPGKSTSWAVIGEVDRPCDISNQTVTVMTGEQTNQGRSMVLTRIQISFSYGEDVTVLDRIYDLKYSDDTLVDPTIKYWEIKELIPDEFQLSFAIQAIR